MKLTKKMILTKSRLAVCLASSLIISTIVIPTTLLAIQNNNKARTIKNLKTTLEKINKKEEDRDNPALIAARNNFLAQKAKLKNWVSTQLNDKSRQYKAIEQAGVPPHKPKLINLLTTKMTLDKRTRKTYTIQNNLNPNFYAFMKTKDWSKLYTISANARILKGADGVYTFLDSHWPIEYIEIEDEGNVHKITNLVGSPTFTSGRKWTSDRYRSPKWPATSGQHPFKLIMISFTKGLQNQKNISVIDEKKISFRTYPESLSRFKNPVLKSIMVRFDPKREWSSLNKEERRFLLLVEEKKLTEAFTSALMKKINE